MYKLTILLVFLSIPLRVLSQPLPDHWPDHDAPMTFKYAYTGGNCLTCTWIAAQGLITEDTPDAFRRFLDNLDPTDLGGVNVHLNSKGGRLLAGVELGEIIRERVGGTVIAETSGKQYDHGLRDLFLESDDAICLSACVFAFLGGKSRLAHSGHGGISHGYQKLGKLGVHQFFDPEDRSNGQSAIFTQLARASDQEATGQLLEYLFRMRVSPEILRIGLGRRPWQEPHWITDNELIELGIDTRASFQEVSLVGYENGVGIVEVLHSSRDADYKFEYFCENDRTLNLKLQISWKAKYDPRILEKDSTFHEVFLNRDIILVAVDYQHSTNERGTPTSTIFFRSPTSKVSDLIGATALNFSASTEALSHQLQIVGALSTRIDPDFTGFYVLPRLCIP